MLVLSREVGEEILIKVNGEVITRIKVCGFKRSKGKTIAARIGLEAGSEIEFLRGELPERPKRPQKPALQES